MLPDLARLVKSLAREALTRLTMVWIPAADTGDLGDRGGGIRQAHLLKIFTWGMFASVLLLILTCPSHVPPLVVVDFCKNAPHQRLQIWRSLFPGGC